MIEKKTTKQILDDDSLLNKELLSQIWMGEKQWNKVWVSEETLKKEIDKKEKEIYQRLNYNKSSQEYYWIIKEFKELLFGISEEQKGVKE